MVLVLNLTEDQKQAENSKTHIPPEKILKAKGILDYFHHIDENILKKRVIYGWLEKRSKGAVKYFQTRWFILVSAKPLVIKSYCSSTYANLSN